MSKDQSPSIKQFMYNTPSFLAQRIIALYAVLDNLGLIPKYRGQCNVQSSGIYINFSGKDNNIIKKGKWSSSYSTHANIFLHAPLNCRLANIIYKMLYLSRLTAVKLRTDATAESISTYDWSWQSRPPSVHGFRKYDRVSNGPHMATRSRSETAKLTRKILKM